MKRGFLLLACLMFALSATAQAPKYVFMFIGDGMGPVQLQVTQAALAANQDKIGLEELSFTTFPIVGTATTHSASSFITDSAAAGTALASGHKTKNGVLGMCKDGKESYSSVAVKAKEEGMKVGIITTVSIDHATPAAYYAHVPNRSMYREIANFLPQSEFDLFAGSGLKRVAKNYYDSISKNNGYRRAIGNKATLKGKRVVWTQSPEKSQSALSLAIDRNQGDMNLPDMTAKSIKFLDNKDGFFLMAEAGQIDWAAHDNDAATIVAEVIDLSEAVAKAVEFYNQHPDETLIIVTADHETGGMTIGRDDRGYNTNLDRLFEQEGSLSKVGQEKMKSTNKNSGVGFTTGAHTGVRVPVYVIGVGAERFAKNLDNTDIPKILDELISNQSR